MFNTRTQRVVFTSGILFVLTLAIFSLLISVAWMSMNNTMAVTADCFDGTAQADVALASRVGNDVPTVDSRIGDDVPTVDSRIGDDVPILHRQFDLSMFRSFD